MRKAIFGSLLLFLLAMLIGMLSKPAAFERFFIAQAPIFDAAHYLKIATEGYVEPPLAAFYPLWPLLLKYVVLPLQSPHTVLIGSLLAFIIFAFSLWPFFKVALRDLPLAAAFCLLCLYVLNPNSLFHILLYTESLTALCGSLFLLNTSLLLNSQESPSATSPSAASPSAASPSATSPSATSPSAASPSTASPSAASPSRTRSAVFAALSLFALSLARPVALPLMASAGAATLCVFYFRSNRPQDFFQHIAPRRWNNSLILLTVATILIVVLAYIPYGLHAQQQYGHFFAPFDAQKFWDRKFGLHWDILFKPKSVSSSDNVLFWDIQAFYLPLLLAALPFLGRWRIVPQAFARLGDDWLYWLCAFFAAAHAAIAFLTYPIFMSLARHVFALPFFFYCVARILKLFWEKTAVRKVAWGYAALSFAFLVYWWSRYAREGWLG
jgi:hypothetical protein